jgi:carotenoid 1,2-hydratase
MTEKVDKTVAPGPVFSSSLAADVWHAQTAEKAYEWWYFDALSDDGREAVVVVFYDNYVFSPRYSMPSPSQRAEAEETDPEDTLRGRFPAVTLLYTVDGKTVFRTVNEFSSRHFDAGTAAPECRIGSSSFVLESAAYGSGYLLSVNVPLGPRTRLEATFEWLTVEGDFQREIPVNGSGSSRWNMVVSRSDVSGRIEVINRKGRSKRIVHFRGTGYHDQRSGSKAIHEEIGCRQWGRAHFSDRTVIFNMESDVENVATNADLILTRDGGMSISTARVEMQRLRRDKFGIRYPSRLSFLTDGDIRIFRVKPIETIESTFCKLRFLSEMTLVLRDGKLRKAIGISEIISPKNIKYRLFRWLSDLRIGKNGDRPVF